MTTPNLALKGRLKVDVCDHKGRVLREGEWHRNLMLDDGMDRIADTPICDLFLYAGKGMATDVTSAAKTGTWTLSGSTLSRASGADTFSASDIGQLVRSSNGIECIVDSGTGTSVTVVPVGSGSLTNFTAKAITLYAVNQTWLDVEEDDVTIVDPASITMDFDGTDTVTSDAALFDEDRDVGRYIYFNAAKVRFKITAFTSDQEVTVENLDSAAAISGEGGTIYDPVRDWTLIDSSSTTFDYDDAGALTRNGSTGDFEFTEDHVGAVFYEESNNARLRVTAFVSEDEVTVVELDACAAFSAQALHLLTDDENGGAKCRATDYIDGECGTTTATDTRTFTRSFMFESNEREETYEEVVLSHEALPGDNLNIRVKIPSTTVAGPVGENPGERLKVTYQLSLTVSPATKQNNASTPITGGGWNAQSKSIIESFSTSVVNEDGSTDATYMLLEPSAVGDDAHLGITTLNQELIAFSQQPRTGESKPLLKKPYSNGTFYTDRYATFEANEAVGTGWRAITIYDPSSEVAPFVTQYLSKVTKLNTHRLSVTHRTSWSRNLA